MVVHHAPHDGEVAGRAFPNRIPVIVFVDLFSLFINPPLLTLLFNYRRNSCDMNRERLLLTNSVIV